MATCIKVAHKACDRSTSIHALKMLLVFMMVGQCAHARDVWFDASSAQDRLWTNTAGWFTSYGCALGHVPSFEDKIWINASMLTPETPLVIPANCEAVCQLVRFATSSDASNYATDGRIPSLTLYGTLQTPSNTTDAASISIGEAYGGYGLMRIENGALITNANLTVGNLGIGVVTNNGGALYLSKDGNRNLTVGGESAGVGTYVQNDGILSANNLHIGYHATGTVEIAGGLVSVQDSCFVGIRSSEGRLVIRGGDYSGDIKCGFASGGHGVLEVTGGNIASPTVIIGQGGSGEFIFRGGTTTIYNLVLGSENGSCGGLDVESAEQLRIGGLLKCGDHGRGMITLRGGAVQFTKTNASDENILIGCNSDGWGCLRGYGKIAPSSTGATNVRIGGGNCIILADGEGANRDLDLNEVVSISNHYANVDVATSTNGWYAINKGRVCFPRIWFNSVNAQRCIGDAPNSVEPRFVNSVRCSFTGVSGSNTFLRGGLYATDRSDIPAGLLSGDVIGVWNFGLFNSVNGTTLVPFSNVSLTFRYDHTKVRGDRTLKLMRYNGTQWTLVGRALQNEEHLISTGVPVVPLSGGSMNIGFFAVCIPKNGLSVFVR